ncbi:MAG: hypothetical protein D6701_03125 [Gemmatimonadetes bacterium]|nr:MAG: hypothetical protein D6701_03125 [Gemmatimonadota bacterium]
MDCHEARATLWPPERLRLAEPDVVRARAHVQACAACSEYFDQDRCLLEVYDRLRRTRAPRRVRERVFDALARERAGLGSGGVEVAMRSDVRRVRDWRPVRIAAMLVVAAAGFWGLSRVSGDLPRASLAATTGDEFVEDYVRRAVGEDNIDTSDPAVVARFLVRELGLQLRPLQLGGLRLAGAEICLVDGRRGAMIRYVAADDEQTVVSHYIIPSDGARPRRPMLSKAAPGEPGGPSVVTWATPSVEQALVGELPADALLLLARNASLD